MGLKAHAKHWGFRVTHSLFSSVTSMARMAFSGSHSSGRSTPESDITIAPSVKAEPKPEQKKLFALLIGINTYNNIQTDTSLRDNDAPTFSNLRGAVTDAEMFHEYLVSDLGVPEDQITFLRDQQATRDNIIKAFLSLANNDKISRGDVIFIFYAGHGAQVLPPRRLLGMRGCPEKVELLIPHDYGKIPAKHESMGIPDYTLAAMLNQIAAEKGNNITLVFDCCHSASALRGGTKDAEMQMLTRSGPELTYHLPDDLDSDILEYTPGLRGLRTPPPLRNYGSTSYVFFAACASSELAREHGGRGCFTTAMLKFLKEVGHNSLPCSQIITKLPHIEGQNPQCEGLHQDRLIFHGYVSSYDRAFFDICEKPASLNGDRSYSFTMREGRAHGFSKGDELTIYKSKSIEDRENPVGVLVIDSFDEITGGARLQRLSRHPHFRLPCQPAPALLTKSTESHLKLHVDPESPNLSARIQRLGLSNIVLATSVNAAYVSISIGVEEGEERLRFDVVDQDLFRQYPKLKLKPRFAPNTDDDLHHILDGLAHYYWHLKRSSDSLPLTDISVSFFRLQDTFTGQPRFVVEDGTRDLCSASNLIDLEIDDEALYGMELLNNSGGGGNLYPVLFYFDNTDFTITPSYKHPTAGGNPESPWPGPSMTIGYGVGSGSTVSPFSFFMDENYDMEAGFFKIVLSNKPIDLQNMVQTESPFTRSRAMKQKTQATQEDPLRRWGSIVLTVITRRKV